jgi:ABC-type transport system involved in Fe-S cluster assembly fused permease/ATPase subunit
LTLVVIGHRLSMVESADQVIILKDGDVLRVANWEESSLYLASVT